MERSLTKEIVLGSGAAFAASKVMDQVTIAYQQRQSEASVQREKQAQEELSFEKAAQKIAELRGEKIDEEQRKELGQRLHVGLGISGGVIAGFLAARGMNPVKAGLLTGLGIWLFVDEGANAVLGFTPPATEFPPETHIRGLLGHLAYGGALGVFLGVGNLLFVRKKKKNG